MGKKKSKTAKKKQAKAASRAKQAKTKTTAFGVSVVKGSKGRGGAAGGGGGHGGNDHAASSVGHNNVNKKGGGSGRINASPSASHNMKHDTMRLRQAVSKDDERNDFDRQHASLQERADARQRQQKAGGKKRGNRKHQQRVQEPQPSSLFSNLAQSSIKLGPTTVGEMVDDAADQVAAGMTAIGAALSPVGGTAGRPAAPPNTPSSTGGGSTNMLQVLAAQKRQEWTAQKYMLQPESKAKDDDQMGDNRFAGLDNGDSDSDDNGWGAGAGGDQPVHAPPTFDFAPASFAWRNDMASAQQHPGGDDDPDL